MSPVPRRRRALSAAASCLAALALTCSACSSTAASSPPKAQAPSIAAQLSASVRSRGVFRVAMAASYAPNEFIAANGHTIIGMDAELAAALARTGSTYVQQVADEQPVCAAERRARIQAQTYANQADADLALLSKRAQVTIEDSPVAAYQARVDHRFRVTGRIFGTAPYGIAVSKTSGLARPIAEALRMLISNGTYIKIMDKWGIATGAISTPVINGATS